MPNVKWQHRKGAAYGIIFIFITAFNGNHKIKYLHFFHLKILKCSYFCGENFFCDISILIIYASELNNDEMKFCGKLHHIISVCLVHPKEFYEPLLLVDING